MWTRSLAFRSIQMPTHWMGKWWCLIIPDRDYHRMWRPSQRNMRNGNHPTTDGWNWTWMIHCVNTQEIHVLGWSSVTIWVRSFSPQNPNVLWSTNGVGSPFWKCVRWALSASNTFYKWNVGNGESVSFWHDAWLEDCSLKVKYCPLFEICNQPLCSLAQAWDGANWN